MTSSEVKVGVRVRFSAEGRLHDLAGNNRIGDAVSAQSGYGPDIVYRSCRSNEGQRRRAVSERPGPFVFCLELNLGN